MRVAINIRGMRIDTRLAHAVYIPNFPINILSGEKLYRAGGGLYSIKVRDPLRNVINKLDSVKRGFYIYV